MKRTTVVARPLTMKRTEQLLGQAVAEGWLEVWGVNEHGEPMYAVTPEGEAHVRRDMGEP